MALREQAIAFHRSIDGYKATDYPSAQLYDIFNAIVEQAHQQLSDNAVIAAIKPVADNDSVDVGTLRAAVDQIRTVSPAPSPFVG